MDVIGSNLPRSDPNFADNQARMEALVSELKERLARRAGAAGSRPWTCTAAGASCWSGRG